jgi:dihydrofolate synthase/folylpolyglutamate synthase
MPRLTPTLKYLYGLQTLGIKPGLRRVELLLSLLGNPEKTYPTVIVAGTNGKGSTCAMIVSILTEAGFRVGHYSSPHLIRFNERIKVGGIEITNREISTLTRRLRALVEKNIKTKKDAPSFFEFTTAMAFEHFRKNKVDIVVLEVGMGGRFDATNVTTPLVSVITSIGMDHSEYLGDTIEMVAREKAGVIKKNTQFVTTVRDAAALREIKKEIKEAKVVASFIGRDFRVKKEKGSGRLSYESAGFSLSKFALGLSGGYQLENAAAAIRTIELLSGLGFSVGRAALRRGLARVVWPGRFDLRRTVERGVRVVFDCAHNEAGARALRAALEVVTPISRVTFVVGVMKDKDIDAILSELLPRCASVIVTEPACARSARASGFFKKAVRFCDDAFLIRDVGAAVTRAVADAPARGVVCVTGSIFTVGEALGARRVTELF